MKKYILKYGENLLESFIGKGEILAKPYATGAVQYFINKKNHKLKSIKFKDIESYLDESDPEWKSLPQKIKDISIDMTRDEFKRRGYKVE